MAPKMKVKYPLGIQWRIAEYELQELRSSIDGCLDSDVFEIPGTDVEYFLKIYPNGDNDESRGETWIYLELEFGEQEEIKADFCISIDSVKVSEKLEHVYKKSVGWGEKMCAVDDIFDPAKQFIVDGEMTIKVEGFLIIEMDVPVKLLKLGSAENQLCIGLWNQQNKDFIIVVEKKEIHAHKWVLSTYSPVFAAMFQPHTKEAQENKVTISDFSFDVVEAAIKFCYDASLVGYISLESQMLLLQFFEKYDIQILKNQLEKHLISVIDVTNVCRLTNSAIISNAPRLRVRCTKFLQDCWKTKPVNDFDILNKDFVVELFQNSLFNFSV